MAADFTQIIDNGTEIEKYVHYTHLGNPDRDYYVDLIPLKGGDREMTKLARKWSFKMLIT
jgi:hypothetical protein